MNLEYAKAPKWANTEQTLIDLTIKWVSINEELPFTASPTDTEAHGRDLFERAAAGEFGEVGAYVAPPEILAPPKQFTALEFLDLFTEAEQLAVVTASMSSAPVKLWYDRTLATSYITIADPRTEAGLDALVEAGLLTAARQTAIVGAMQ
jgi:hypothetical protein